MTCTEGLDGPNLHFSETLSTKLRLTTKRLLRDERVWTDGAGVHLVFNHVTKLQEVSYAHGSRLVELLTCFAIVEVSRAETGQFGLVCPLGKVFKVGTVEDRCCEFQAQLLTGSTEDGLENLSQVHTRRHTQGV